MRLNGLWGDIVLGSFSLSLPLAASLVVCWTVGLYFCILYSLFHSLARSLSHLCLSISLARSLAVALSCSLCVDILMLERAVANTALHEITDWAEETILMMSDSSVSSISNSVASRQLRTLSCRLHSNSPNCSALSCWCWRCSRAGHRQVCHRRACAHSRGEECAVYGSRPPIASKPGSFSPERPGLDNSTSQP